MREFLLFFGESLLQIPVGGDWRKHRAVGQGQNVVRDIPVATHGGRGRVNRV